MNPLDQVNVYLRELESRLRWSAISRGIACTALAALIATVVLVLVINAFAFSPARQRTRRMDVAVTRSSPASANNVFCE